MLSLRHCSAFTNVRRPQKRNCIQWDATGESTSPLLFSHYGNYACRFCHRAQYLSQKQKTASRKRLSAAKLRLKLGGWPDIREPMPSKPKRTHRKTYQRIRNEIHGLEAKAKHTRFRKEIDIRTFAYHVGRE
jgi:hypothetical protein